MKNRQFKKAKKSEVKENLAAHKHGYRGPPNHFPYSQVWFTLYPWTYVQLRTAMSKKTSQGDPSVGKASWILATPPKALTAGDYPKMMDRKEMVTPFKRWPCFGIYVWFLRWFNCSSPRNHQ